MGKALYRAGDQTVDTDELSFTNFLYRGSSQLLQVSKVFIADGNGVLKEVWPGEALQDPTNLSASPSGDRSIALSWTDNSEIEDSYTVQYSDDGGSTWSNLVTGLSPDTTSYTDDGTTAPTLTDGQERHYRVRAEQDNGDTSGWSNVASAITNLDTPPLSSATATGPDSIEIDISSFSDDWDAIEVHRSTSGGAYSKIDTINNPGASDFPYEDTGLANGTQYCYKLKGVGPDTTTGFSTEHCATTQSVAAETLRPVADVGGTMSNDWTDTDGNGDGWDELDEATPDDASTQISASVDNSNSKTVSHGVELADPVEVHDDSQTWTVQVRWRSTHGFCSSGSVSKGLTISVTLNDINSTFSRTEQFTHGDDLWGTDTFQLTQAEINEIAANPDFRISIEATITSPCCDNCGTQFPIYTSEGVAWSQAELDIS